MGCQTKPHFCSSERRDEKCDFHLRVIFPKTGYKSKRKVKNYRIPHMLWWCVGTYCLKTFLEMCKLGPIFPKQSIVSLQWRDYGKYVFSWSYILRNFHQVWLVFFFFLIIFLIFCKKSENFNIFKVANFFQKKNQAFLPKKSQNKKDLSKKINGSNCEFWVHFLRIS